jgi:hypothetical protein
MFYEVSKMTLCSWLFLMTSLSSLTLKCYSMDWLPRRAQENNITITIELCVVNVSNTCLSSFLLQLYYTGNARPTYIYPRHRRLASGVGGPCLCFNSRHDITLHVVPIFDYNPGANRTHTVVFIVDKSRVSC